MGLVLAKTFDGQHRWIESDGVMLDAMFFTATSEVPDDGKATGAFKDFPTFILCNPNAMFY